VSSLILLLLLLLFFFSITTDLSLLDHRAELVGGQVHAVEVGQAHLALGLLDDQTELSERIVAVVVQVTERGLEHAALERIGGDLCDSQKINK
jgi:hypothetical protein